jgi:hypothetical protein
MAKARPRREADWLPGQLRQLAAIFDELHYGLTRGHVEGWQRKALEARVRRLLPDVEKLANDAGLAVGYD